MAGDTSLYGPWDLYGVPYGPQAEALVALSNRLSAVEAADLVLNGSVVKLTGAQTVAGAKTFSSELSIDRAADPAAALTLRLGTNPVNPSGTKGLHIIRTADGGATGLLFFTGTRLDYVMGLDLAATWPGEANSDFVFLYDPAPNKGDVFRHRTGPFMCIANHAMPDTESRLWIKQVGTDDDIRLRNLLKLSVADAGSLVTHALKTECPAAFGLPAGIRMDGRIGAGIADPIAQLHVNVGTVTTRDSLAMTRANSAPPLFVAFNQGTGTADWRVGQPGNANHLEFFYADGAVGSASAPGTSRLRLETDGRLTLGGLGRVAMPDTSSDNEAGLSWLAGGTNYRDYGITRTAGAWSGPNYAQMRIAFQTGILLSPGTAFAKSYVDVIGGGLKTAKFAVGAAAPMAPPAGTPAASTDLASVITLANYLRTQHLAYGLST